MRLPEGICSPPDYLKIWYALHYESSIEDQYNYEIKNNAVLKEGERFLHRKTLDNAKTLLNLIFYLLAHYKKPEEIEFPVFHAEIKKMNTWETASEIDISKAACSTDFLFTKRLKGRILCNHLLILDAIQSSYALTAQNPCEITVGEFCRRAQDFLNISITYDDLYQNYPIAKLLLKEKKSNPGKNTHIRHEYAFLNNASMGTRALLQSFYDQLLAIIFSSKNTSIPEEKLNAIFLLVFLIGSNPPMYYQKKIKNNKTIFFTSGGAFITDAILQFLLLKADFKPVRKNFLHLTEISLLMRYGFQSNDNALMKQKWEEPIQYYQAALAGNTTFLFHPISCNDRKQLLSLLSKYTLEIKIHIATVAIIILLLESLATKKHHDLFLIEFLKNKKSFALSSMPTTVAYTESEKMLLKSMILKNRKLQEEVKTLPSTYDFLKSETRAVQLDPMIVITPPSPRK